MTGEDRYNRLSLFRPDIATLVLANHRETSHSLAKERMNPCSHGRKFLLCEPNKFFLIRIVKMKPVQRFLHPGWKTTSLKEAEIASGIQLRGGKLRLRLHDAWERNLASRESFHAGVQRVGSLSIFPIF